MSVKYLEDTDTAFVELLDKPIFERKFQALFSLTPYKLYFYKEN